MTTDNLTTAVAAWITEAVTRLDQERLTVLQTCLEAPGADVQLVVRLREGAIVLEATTAGKRLELHRAAVESLQSIGMLQ